MDEFSLLPSPVCFQSRLAASGLNVTGRANVVPEDLYLVRFRLQAQLEFRKRKNVSFISLL
jgi:hypothetical protein